MIALFFLLLLFAMTAVGWLPFVLTLFYFIVSGCTFCLYGLDKVFALKNRQRISEKKLHLFALFGGWPGAYIGQQVFWHKVSKSNFFVKFYLLVFMNVGALSIFLMLNS